MLSMLMFTMSFMYNDPVKFYDPFFGHCSGTVIEKARINRLPVYTVRAYCDTDPETIRMFYDVSEYSLTKETEL